MPFFAKVGRDGVDDAETNVVAGKGNGELVGQDVLLRFEIGGLEGEDFGQRRGRGPNGEERVGAEDLGETVCGEGVFGRDIQGWAREAAGRGELRGEEKS